MENIIILLFLMMKKYTRNSIQNQLLSTMSWFFCQTNGGQLQTRKFETWSIAQMTNFASDFASDFATNTAKQPQKLHLLQLTKTILTTEIAPTTRSTISTNADLSTNEKIREPKN